MIKKIFLILILMLVPTISCATDYNINDYHIKIEVSEDNIYNITEKITVDFKHYKRGIYRNIPLERECFINNNTTRTFARISNIKSTDYFNGSKNNGYEVVQLWDIHKQTIGEKNYEVSYTYDIGNDISLKCDKFYFDIIDKGWDTLINNVTFEIIMPKEFNANDINFYIGKNKEKNVEYFINDNIITGKLNRQINPKETFSIDISLPEGYFVEKENTYFLSSYIKVVDKNYLIIDFITFIVPLVSLIFIGLIWWKLRKENKVKEIFEFSSPDNLNSVELAYIYKGKVKTKDVLSLLLYLGNKGYLSIDENGKCIEKLKEYDGNNDIEKMFMNGLFNDSTFVWFTSLKHKFHKIVKEIKKEVKNKYSEKVFDKNLISIKLISSFMIIISAIVVVVRQYILDIIYTPLFFLIECCIFWGSLLVLGVFCIFLINRVLIVDIPNLKKGTKQDIFSFTLAFLICMFALIWIPITILDLSKGIIPNIKAFSEMVKIGIVFIGLMIIFLKNMESRTMYGREIKAKVLGFKKHLIQLNEYEINTKFYDMLSYIFVLNLLERWGKKLNNVEYRKVDWYNCDNKINSYEKIIKSFKRTIGYINFIIKFKPRYYTVRQ